MTRSEGAGAARDPRQIQPQEKMAEPAAKKKKKKKRIKKQASDSIELSGDAMKLADKPAGSKLSREARIEAARLRIKSGALESPEALRNAAENLLRSGDLKAAEDES